MGLGLFWGEGNKKSKGAIRIGNTDPDLINVFLDFLENFFSISRKESKLSYGLQIFSDMDSSKALNFWQKNLHVRKQQFQKVIITPTRGIGNYREKTKYGVLTVYFNNTKAKKIIDVALEKFRIV